MKKRLLKLSIHFINSVICLLLFEAELLAASIFWILAPYKITKFADTASRSTGSLLIMLIVEGIILYSPGNFRTLAKIIWPHMCEFIWDSLLMVHWSLCLFCYC